MKPIEIVLWVVGVFAFTVIIAIFLPEAFGLYFPQLAEFSGVKQVLMLALISSIITPIILFLIKPVTSWQ